MCPVLRPDALAAAAVESGAHDIDVAALLQMYVTRASAAGAVVHRSCRLDRAERANGRWVLHHASGTVRADIVVNAAGAWADEVAARFGAWPCNLRPLRRTIAIARTEQPVSPAWPLVATVDEGFYFRPEGPNVLISPADETPSEPCDARPDEADVALAIDRVNRVTDLAIRSVVTTWAGLRTFAPDRNPVVGFDPDVAGLFWLAGQGGYGIQTAPGVGPPRGGTDPRRTWFSDAARRRRSGAPFSRPLGVRDVGPRGWSRLGVVSLFLAELEQVFEERRLLPLGLVPMLRPYHARAVGITVCGVDELVQLAAVKPHAPAARAVVDLDTSALGDQQRLTVDRTEHGYLQRSQVL